MTRSELFEQNQNLVYFCYHRYMKKACPSNHVEDIMQEGRIALWEACRGFDESRGFAFSTYAIPFILGRMKKYIRDKIPVIRIPRSAWESGDINQYQVQSLDFVISDENNATIGDLIPANPDDYENLTEQLMNDFLEWERELLNRTSGISHTDRSLAIMEEWLYGEVFFERPTQHFLAEKYHISQPQVARIIKRCSKDFQKFLDVTQSGGA